MRSDFFFKNYVKTYIHSFVCTGAHSRPHLLLYLREKNVYLIVNLENIFLANIHCLFNHLNQLYSNLLDRDIQNFPFHPRKIQVIYFTRTQAMCHISYLISVDRIGFQSDITFEL